MSSFRRTDRCQAANPATCWKHGDYILPAATSIPVHSHKDASGKVKFFLTDTEQQAITGYLNQDYTQLNAALKGGEPLTSELSRQIETIHEALTRSQKIVSSQEPLLTFRATKTYCNFSSLQETHNWMKEHFKEGSTITLPGFTSVTANPAAIFDFLTVASEDEKPNVGMMPWQSSTAEEWYKKKESSANPGLGNLVFVVEARTGVPVSGYGQFHSDKELEYLYPKDTKFKVKKVLPYRRIPHPDPEGFRKSAHASVVFLEETR